MLNSARLTRSSGICSLLPDVMFTFLGEITGLAAIIHRLKIQRIDLPEVPWEMGNLIYKEVYLRPRNAAGEPLCSAWFRGVDECRGLQIPSSNGWRAQRRVGKPALRSDKVSRLHRLALDD